MAGPTWDYLKKICKNSGALLTYIPKHSHLRKEFWHKNGILTHPIAHALPARVFRTKFASFPASWSLLNLPMKSASSDILVYYSAIAVLGTGMVTEYVTVTVRRPSIGHRCIEYFLGQLLAKDWSCWQKTYMTLKTFLHLQTHTQKLQTSCLLISTFSNRTKLTAQPCMPPAKIFPPSGMMLTQFITKNPILTKS